MVHVELNELRSSLWGVDHGWLEDLKWGHCGWWEAWECLAWATRRQGWTSEGLYRNIKALNLYHNSKGNHWHGRVTLLSIYTLERTLASGTETSYIDQGWRILDQLRSYCDILGWDESSARVAKAVGKKWILSEALLNWTGLVDALDRDEEEGVRMFWKLLTYGTDGWWLL